MTTPLLARPAERPARNWRLDGNCTTAAVDMHPDDKDHASEQAAKKICAGCPVATQCLTESLRLGDWYGIRAGLTGPERRNLNADRPAKRCARCQDLFVPRLDHQIRCRPCARANDTRNRRRHRQ